MGTNDLLPSARHCCPLFVHKNMSELSVIPKASKFFPPEQHICCQIVVAKIISKMQGEQKCLHVVCLSFYFMLMWFCLVVFCGMYICQVTYVASQFPQEDK